MDLDFVADLEVGEPGDGVARGRASRTRPTGCPGDLRGRRCRRRRRTPSTASAQVLAAGVLLGLPLDVEGADRGGVVLVAGHDVHRAAGDVAVVEQPGPALGDVDARLGGRRARRARRRAPPSPRVAVVPGGRPWPSAVDGAFVAVRRCRPRARGAAAGAAAAGRARARRRGRRPGRGGPRAGRRRAPRSRRAAGLPGRPSRRAPPRRRPRAPSSPTAPSTAARARPMLPAACARIEREIPPSGPFPRY